MNKIYYIIVMKKMLNFQKKKTGVGQKEVERERENITDKKTKPFAQDEKYRSPYNHSKVCANHKSQALI